MGNIKLVLVFLLHSFVAQSVESSALRVDVGVLVRMHGNAKELLGDTFRRFAASAVMAAQHVNTRNPSLVPDVRQLLPAGFEINIDIRDSFSSPSHSIKHVNEWGEMDAIVGSYRSAVTGPVSLVASISQTPVISWASTASTLADKNTYPTLSRTVTPDSVLANGMISVIKTLGWKRIGIIAVNDAYGSSWAADASASGSQQGIEIAANVKFFTTNHESVKSAVAMIAEAEVRVIVCIAFDSDIPAIVRSAKENGIIGEGYIWLAADSFGSQDMVASVETEQEKAELLEGMTGWFQFEMNALFGESGDLFHSVLRSQPLHVFDNPLVNITQEVLESALCQTYCAYIYDAVFAIAIAAAQTDEVEGDIDKPMLLRKIRGVDFHGASGRVVLNSETGDREPTGVPLLVKNLRSGIDVNGQPRLEESVAWVWTPTKGLTAQSDPPVWPGGQQTWDMPQLDVVCGSGFVFSQTTLKCEPCPPRTDEVDGVCVPFNASVGILVRLHGMAGEDLGDGFKRIAASALMAVEHINSRSTRLVPDANTLLPDNFRLSFDIRDSFSAPSSAVQSAVVWGEEGQDLIVGSFRSAVTAPLGLAASIYNTPVISWASTSSSLSDKGTYPMVSRTVPSDAILAFGIVKAIQELKWARFSLLFIDDAYGRAVAQDLASSAAGADIEVAASQKYFSGDAAGIEQGVATLKATGSRINVVIAFDSDIPTILAALAKHGMLGEGYVWISNDSFLPNDVIANSDTPELLASQLTGFFRVEVDFLHGENGARYHDVLHSEPMEHLNHAGFFEIDHDILTSGPCFTYCASMYDAVWTAAIAASRASRTATGAIDKTDLLQRVREVEFSGATGRVVLNEAGDRSAEGVVVLIKNIYSDAARRAESVTSAVTWTWTVDAGLQRESDIPPVWYSGGERTWDAPSDGASCEAGEIFHAELLECVACPPGSYSHSRRDTTCTLCPFGAVAELPGSTRCEPCVEGYADEPGLSECRACPVNTYRIPGPGTNVTECVCLPGFFSRQGAGLPCEDCVTGGDCPGGTDLPFPRASFWGDEQCSEFGGAKDCPYPFSFMPCNPADNCLDNFQCEEGRTGNLCSSPNDHWTVVGGLWWMECGETGNLWSILGILAVFFVWFGINRLASGEYDALNIALLYVQITAVISTYGLKWHNDLEIPQIALGVANFDVDFVTPQCLGSWDAVWAFYVQLLLPFLFGLMYAIYFWVAAVVRQWMHRSDSLNSVFTQMWRGTLKNTVSMLLIVYTTLSLKCLQTFRCEVFPDGKLYMVFAPDVECWKGHHLGMAVVSGCYIVVVLLGLPLLLVWVVRRHLLRGTLHEVQVMEQWSFVHAPYETEYKYWECMLLLRRFAVALIAVSVDEPMLQASATIVLLTVLLAAHVFTRPFIVASIDVLDFFSILGSMFYVLAGLLMYPSLTKTAQGHLCDLNGAGPNHFCDKDMVVKQAVAIICNSTVFFTILIAAVLTFLFVREKRHSAQAAKAIDEQLEGIIGRERSSITDSIMTHSVNKTRLDEILDGNMLLAWVQKPEAHSGSQFALDTPSLDRVESDASAADFARATSSGTSARKLKRSWTVRKQDHARAYVNVERKMNEVELDLTEYSTEVMAEVLRQLCEIKGLCDYLCWKRAKGLDGLRVFLEEFADYVREAERQNLAQKQAAFPVHEIVKFEFRPLFCHWVLHSERTDKDEFLQLMDQIMLANGRCLVDIHHDHSHAPKTAVSGEVCITSTTPKSSGPPAAAGGAETAPDVAMSGTEEAAATELQISLLPDAVDIAQQDAEPERQPTDDAADAAGVGGSSA